jgi:hypothetical protein
MLRSEPLLKANISRQSVDRPTRHQFASMLPSQAPTRIQSYALHWERPQCVLLLSHRDGFAVPERRKYYETHRALLRKILLRRSKFGNGKNSLTGRAPRHSCALHEYSGIRGRVELSTTRPYSSKNARCECTLPNPIRAKMLCILCRDIRYGGRRIDQWSRQGPPGLARCLSSLEYYAKGQVLWQVTSAILRLGKLNSNQSTYS